MILNTSIAFIHFVVTIGARIVFGFSPRFSLALASLPPGFRKANERRAEKTITTRAPEDVTKEAARAPGAVDLRTKEEWQDDQRRM